MDANNSPLALLSTMTGVASYEDKLQSWHIYDYREVLLKPGSACPFLCSTVKVSPLSCQQECCQYTLTGRRQDLFVTNLNSNLPTYGLSGKWYPC